MLYKEFEKNREDILENEFCMQSNASTLPITDCPSYTPIFRGRHIGVSFKKTT